MLKKSITSIIIIAAAILTISSITIFTKAASPPQPNPPENDDLQTQKQLIISYIESAKDVNAQETFEKLLIDFGGTEDVVPAIYEIAEKYRQLAKYKSAIDAYRYILDNFPDAEQAIWAQRSVASSYIGLGNIDTAKTETQKLIDNFQFNPNIAQAVFELADTYYWFGKNPEAQQLYQKVIDSWPAAQHAMWAQMGLAISYIADNNDLAAQNAADSLILNYPDNEKLPEALFYIAGRYGWGRKYEQARNLYRYIIEQYPQTDWAGNAGFESAKLSVYPLLDAKDEANALIAIDEFIADFGDREAAAAAVYDFAARYDWQNKHELNDFTEAICRKVIDKYPASRQAVSSEMIISRMDILSLVNSGDDPNALAAIDTLIADFDDHPDLPHMISSIEEGYYNKIFLVEGLSLEDWIQPLIVWEKVMEKVPDFSYNSPDLYYFIAACYYKLGEYEAALVYFNKAAAGWPDNRWGRDAQEMIMKTNQKLVK